MRPPTSLTLFLMKSEDAAFGHVGSLAVSAKIMLTSRLSPGRKSLALHSRLMRTLMLYRCQFPAGLLTKRAMSYILRHQTPANNLPSWENSSNSPAYGAVHLLHMSHNFNSPLANHHACSGGRFNTLSNDTAVESQAIPLPCLLPFWS
jgi:hypothetical protein